VEKKYRVTLTPEERADLERMTRTGKAAATKLTHARILLLADESSGGPARSDGRIMEALGVSKNTVCRVRERLVEQGLESALVRKPSARTYARKLDGRGEAHLIALACSDPPAGRADWTLQLLADQMVAMGHVKQLSYETVRQVLKKTRSSRG
jgi:Homeodomain-like domain